MVNYSKGHNTAGEEYELFFQMEKKFRLFELRTNDGFPIWDIIRFYAWRSIIFADYDDQAGGKKKNISAFLKFIFFFKVIFSFIRLFFNKSGLFYFGLSRIQDEKGCYYDPYFNSFKSLLSNKIIFFESVLFKDKYSIDKRIFDITPFYQKVLQYIPGYINRDKKLNGDVGYIIAAVKQSFNNSSIQRVEIEALLNEFRIQFSFYRWLFRVKKIKKVLLFNSGQKALCKAARDNKIPVFEFQHGDIVDASVMYNYGYAEFDVKDNIIFPNVLLTFSDIWTSGKFIPAKCIEIGTNFFNHQLYEATEPNSITIISSNEQNAYLEKFVLELAMRDKEIRIYYKLHPQQFATLEKQKAYFKELSNVVVISSEKNMADMIRISNEFIAIYSTAMFEILQAGKIVYIYKLLNYKFFKSYFTLPGVFLFEQMEDFYLARKKALNTFSKDNAPKFFKPFNSKAFLDAIDNYRMDEQTFEM